MFGASLLGREDAKLGARTVDRLAHGALGLFERDLPVVSAMNNEQRACDAVD